MITKINIITGHQIKTYLCEHKKVIWKLVFYQNLFTAACQLPITIFDSLLPLLTDSSKALSLLQSADWGLSTFTYRY